MAAVNGATDLGQRGLNYGRDAFAHSSQADSELVSLITDVPRLNGIMALVCAVLNIVLAGFGTVVAGFLATKDGWNKT